MPTKLVPKRNRPETPGQAHTWDRNKHHYLEAGYCLRCACQAAWGHQIGFTNTQPVGDCCAGKPTPVDAGERAARWAANGHNPSGGAA